MGEILDELLVGDVKCEFADEVLARSFLQELQELMIRYCVSKVDLCFRPDFVALARRDDAD